MKQILTFAITFLCVTGVSYAQTTTTNLNPSKDCSAAYLGTSVTANNNLELENSYTIFSSSYTRIFIQFDLSYLSSGIPEDAIITGATLRMPIISEAFTNISVQRITSSWTETGTYTTPAFTTVNQVNTSTTTGIIYRNFDLTAMVNDLRNGLNVNYGFMIRRSTETTVNAVNKYSSSNSGSKPELSITWYPRIKITSAIIVPASTTSALDGSITPTLTGGPGGTYTYNWAQDNGAFGASTTLNQSGLSKGCYYLKVTPPSGDIYYMAFLVGVKCEVVSINFSRVADMHNYMDDAMYRPGYSPLTTNEGNFVNIFSKRSSADNEFTRMRFRLWMDNGIKPMNAQLYLYNDGHGITMANDSRLDLITNDWIELLVHRGTAPSTSSSTSVTVPATSTTTENKIIEITDFWNVWKANNATNYGFYFLLNNLSSNTYRGQEYHSSDASNTALRPTISFVVDDATCDRTSYTQMKTEMDGGYATTHLGKLKFYFDEEYAIDQGKKIPLKLYDENHQLIAGIDINGQVVSGQPLLPGFTYTFGDNRHLLDLTSYSLTQGKFYELELTRSTGEKLYMKFVYQN